MAKAVNQNDLVDIIKAQIESLSDIMTVVFKSVNKRTLSMGAGTEMKMKLFKSRIEEVYGPKGILSLISNIKIQDIKPITWRDRMRIKKAIKRVVKLAQDIVNCIPKDNKSVKSQIKEFILRIKPINELIKTLIDLIDNIKKIGIKDLISIWWKGKLLRKAIKMIAKLANDITRELSKTNISPKVIMDLAMLVLVVAGVHVIVKLIKSTKTLFVRRKIKSITRLFGPLQKLVNRIIRMRRVGKAMMEAIKLAIFVMAIKNIVINLIILAPLLMVLTLLSPLLLLGMLALIVVLRVIRIMVRFMSKRMVLSFLFLNLVVMLLCILAMLLIVLGMLALPLIQLLPAIGLYFLAIIIIMVLMMVAGMIINPMTKYLRPFLKAIGTLLLVVAALWAIGYMFQQIEKMELNVDKIKANVKKIMQCIFSIVEALFETSYELVGGKEEDGVIAKIFYAVVGGFAAYYGLMAASKILMLAVVVVAILWAIGWLLDQIEALDINGDDINEKVKSILDAVNGVIYMLFFGQYENPTPANEPWYQTVLEWGAGTYVAAVKLAGAILAIAYLALMFVVLFLVLCLAGMLWCLEQLNITPENATATIQNVFACCRAALNACMGIDTGGAQPEKSQNTWLGDLLSFIGSIFAGPFVMLVSIIQAILAIAYVALMVIAIALILLLAGMLKLLEQIKITPASINKTVQNVFACCRAALNACMGIGTSGADTEESDKSWLGDLLDFMGSVIAGPFVMLVSIIQAILAIAYVALMVIAILLILLLAGLLKLLEMIPLDKKKIETNVQTVMSACAYVNDSVGGTAKDPAGGQKQSYWEKIMQWGANLFGGLANIISALVSIIYIALAIVAIFLILILAGLLKLLEVIPLDKKLIEKNIDITIGAAVYVGTAISRAKAKEAQKGEENGSSLMSWFLPDSMVAIIEALSTILFIAIAIVAMALIIALASLLPELTKIKLDDASIKRNTDLVLGVAVYITNAVAEHVKYIENQKDNDLLDFDLIEDFEDLVEDYYKPMFTSIENLSSIIKKINNNVQNVNRDEIVKKIIENIGVATDIVKHLNTLNFDMNKAERNLKLLERTADAIHKIGKVTSKDVDNSRQITDNYIKFIDKINSSDFQKLDVAAQLFESFATLAESIKGDFNGLAECINENIMPVLKETQELLKKLPAELEDAGTRMADELQKAVSNIQTSMPSYTDPYSTSSYDTTTTVAPTDTTTDTTTPLWADKQVAYQGMKDQTRWQYNSMQDIIDIMTGVDVGKGMRVRVL